MQSLPSAPPSNCFQCKNTYTVSNLPHQLVNCNHFVCKKCVVTQENCKKCGESIGIDEHDLRDFCSFQLNQYNKCVREINEKMNFSTNLQHFDKNNVEQCLLHSKPADLICIDDGIIICSSCALFGKHKGHEVINREGILLKFTNYIEECLKIYEELKEINGNFSVQKYKAEVSRVLNEEKEKNKKKINQTMESLIYSIKVFEKKEILKLNQYYKEKQKLYEQNHHKIEQIQNEIKNWCSKIESISSLIQNTTDFQKMSECVAYINQKSQVGQQIIKKGHNLIENISETKQNMYFLVGRQTQVSIIQINQQKIKGIQQYCKVQKPVRQKFSKSLFASSQKKSRNQIPNHIGSSHSSKKQSRIKTQMASPFPSSFELCPKTQQQCPLIQDNLLISVQPPKITIRDCPVPIIPKVHMVAQQICLEDIPHLQISNIRPITNQNYSNESSEPSRFMYKNRQLQDIGNTPVSALDGPKKRRKVVEFPEKFRGIVDDLKNDRAETIDLTGAEAGDGSVLALCPFIKKSKKLKTLKLIKNKLTDDCILELMEALFESKINSLNLSQNLLSDKSCILLNSCSLSPNLKTITLSMNKINRRNVKTKIDQIAKKNITVVL